MSSMTYVDGYLLAVPTDRKDAYRDMATKAAVVFKAHGALSVVETWGDDVPEGKLTSFPMAVKREPNETVVFSWITWPSKAVRDDATKKAMDELHQMFEGMQDIFDGKRMIYGGFEVLVDA